MATTPSNPNQAAQGVWRIILTPQMLGKITFEGNKNLLQPPFTLVAIAEQNCETFVSRYLLGDDPIDKMIYGTKGQVVSPPIRVFLFDDSHRPSLQGEIDSNLNLTWF